MTMIEKIYIARHGELASFYFYSKATDSTHTRIPTELDQFGLVSRTHLFTILHMFSSRSLLLFAVLQDESDGSA